MLLWAIIGHISIRYIKFRVISRNPQKIQDLIKNSKKHKKTAENETFRTISCTITGLFSQYSHKNNKKQEFSILPKIPENQEQTQKAPFQYKNSAKQAQILSIRISQKVPKMDQKLMESSNKIRFLENACFSREIDKILFY